MMTDKSQSRVICTLLTGLSVYGLLVGAIIGHIRKRLRTQSGASQRILRYCTLFWVLAGALAAVRVDVGSDGISVRT